MPGMTDTEPEEFVCPGCGKASADPLDMEFGWCGACHDYTGAVAAHQDGADLFPYRYAQGGMMRCCISSLSAWVMLHPGPWERGRWIRCRHHQTMVIFDGEVWRWSNDPKDLEALDAHS